MSIFKWAQDKCMTHVLFHNQQSQTTILGSKTKVSAVIAICHYRMGGGASSQQQQYWGGAPCTMTCLRRSIRIRKIQPRPTSISCNCETRPMSMCQCEGKQGAMAVEDSTLNSRGLYRRGFLFWGIYNEQRSLSKTIR